MSWQREEPNIKIVQWGKLKHPEQKDMAIVVKMEGSIEGTIENLYEKKGEDGEITEVKFRLDVEGESKPVFLYSNTSILRQYQNLDLKVGEKVRFTYVKDYPTQSGNKGRQIVVEVDR